MTRNFRGVLAAVAMGPLVAGLASGCGSDRDVGVEQQRRALVTNFAVGSLVIPMDTTYQDNGMLRAYGLVYDLLKKGVPVNWVINPAKLQDGTDFSATGRDLRSSTQLAAHNYAGGPFVIAAADRAAALPTVNAWLAANPSLNVHDMTAPFSGDVARTLTGAPRIAVFIDGYEAVAFANLNAAGIPDSAGNTWTVTSPDALSEDELSGPSTTNHADGALLAGGAAKYCHVTSMHYTPTSKTNEVVAEVRSWLDSGPNTHGFMECRAIASFESNAMFGRFITTAGLQDDGNPNPETNRVPADPLAQYHGNFTVDTGYVDSMRLSGGSVYRANTRTLINRGSSPLTERVSWMTGYLDGDTNNGRLTYLAGHDYSVTTPVSTNPQANGVRLFLNSFFESGCTTAMGQPDPNVTLTKSAPAATNANSVTFTLSYSNAGPGMAEAVVIRDRVPTGTTFVSATAGGALVAGEVVWSVGNLAAGNSGSVSFTVSVAADATITNAATMTYGTGLRIRTLTSNTTSTVRDTSTPDTMIVSGPPAMGGGSTATFDFSSNEPGVTYECSLDGGAYAACPDPSTFTGLVDGAHSLSVRARDAAGNVDPTPASLAFAVDATLIDTTIVSGPSAVTSSTSATFDFSSNKMGVTYECSLDAAAYAACADPVTFMSLAPGVHTLAVRAKDAMSMVDATPAMLTWTIDTAPPDTMILVAPPAVTAATAALFDFGSSESGVTYECSVDGGAYAACTDPLPLSGLGDGSHNLAVRARDAAGNVDATPATHTWVVDTMAPDTMILTGPPPMGTSNGAMFSFGSNEGSVTYECALDGAIFGLCPPVATFVGLAVGGHTLQVRAVDGAGNRDASPASFSWTVLDASDAGAGTDASTSDAAAGDAAVGSDAAVDAPIAADGPDDAPVGSDGPEDAPFGADGASDGSLGFGDAGMPALDATAQDDVGDAGDDTGVTAGDAATDDATLSGGSDAADDAMAGMGGAGGAGQGGAGGAGQGGGGQGGGGQGGLSGIDPDASTDGLLDGALDGASADADDGGGSGGGLDLGTARDQSGGDGAAGDTGANRDGLGALDARGPDAADGSGAAGGSGQSGDGGSLTDAGGNDLVALYGHGCQCEAAGAGRARSSALWVLAPLALLLRRRRSTPSGSSRRCSTPGAPPWRRGRLLAVAVGLGLALPAMARAGGLDVPVNHFQPTGTLHGYFVSDAGSPLPHLTPAAAMYLHYAHRPLDLVDVRAETIRSEVVKYQLNMDLVVALGLLDRFEIGLALPVTLAQDSGDLGPLGRAAGTVLSGGVGDLRLIPKALLLRTGGLTLALAAPLSVPTGNEQGFIGEGSVSFAPRLLAGYALERLAFVTNVGVRLRKDQSVTLGPQRIEVGHELLGSVGALFRARPGLVDVVADAYFSMPFRDQDEEDVPAELLAGLRLHLPAGVEASVGAGPGLTRGVGTPAFRVLASAAYAHARSPEAPRRPRIDQDPDRDGILGAKDACPNEPEDFDRFEDADGCPDPDNDRDTIVDAKDRCPDQAEDLDQFEDADGCPDPDNDDDKIADAQDKCPNEPEDQDLFEDADGCPDPDNDQDKIADAQDKCPNEPETFNGVDDEDGCPDKSKGPVQIAGRTITVPPVFFATNKDVILPRSFPTLKLVAQAIAANAWVKKVRVEGHTDDRGSERSNLSLSQRRAASVVRFLVQNGVAPERLESQGFGSSQPIALNKTPRGRAENRRVAFVIVDPSGPQS